MAAVFAYSLWQHDRFNREDAHKNQPNKIDPFDNQHRGYCKGTSKGLFVGLMSTVATLIVIIMYFLMKVRKILLFYFITLKLLIVSLLKDKEDYYSELFWLCNGTQLTILSLAIVFTIAGLMQLPKLSLSLQKPFHLDALLTNVTTYGVIIHSVCGKI